MEEPDQTRRPQVDPGEPAFRARLLGAALAGALLAGLVAVVAGLLWLRVHPARGALEPVMARLAGGGWISFPLWGAGLGLLVALRWARTPGERWTAVLSVVAGAMLGIALFWGSTSAPPRRGASPVTARAKARAILKGSFQSPQGVAGILSLAGDPDPTVREQAVLALGVNMIVHDIERATAERPASYAAHPLRDSLRVHLLEALHDSSSSIRAQAARALWKAPRTFGAQPAAAETLAAVLDRATRPGALERLAWLALDAAAGAPHPALKAAAARFSAATPDTELARVAARAAAPREP